MAAAYDDTTKAGVFRVRVRRQFPRRFAQKLLSQHHAVKHMSVHSREPRVQRLFYSSDAVYQNSTHPDFSPTSQPGPTPPVIPASYRNCGICVDLPLPVSPTTTTVCREHARGPHTGARKREFPNNRSHTSVRKNNHMTKNMTFWTENRRHAQQSSRAAKTDCSRL